MYMYVHACTYLYITVRVCAYMNMCIYVCVLLYAYMYIYVHAHAYTCMIMHDHDHAKAQWCNGTMVQWYNPKHITTPRHLPFHPPFDNKTAGNGGAFKLLWP